MINTVVIDFYLDHTREAILKLEEENLIKIKYWLVDKKYNTEESMHSVEMEDILRETYEDIVCPDHLYDEVHKKMYWAMNLDNRWERSTELCNYVHNFNLYIKYWYKVLSINNVEMMLLGNAPHGCLQYVAYLVAKAMGIRIIITEQIYQLKNRFICAKSLEAMGKVEFRFKQKKDHQKIEHKYEKNLFYMKNAKPLLESGEVKLLKKELLNRVAEMIKKERSLWMYKIGEVIGYKLISNYLNSRFKKCRDDLCVEFDSSKKYVYFPLHFQPEMTTDTLGGIYEDQLLAVERLASILPSDWYIYLKENPMQTYYKRSKKFFLRLKSINKARLVRPDISTYTLIQYSQFVSTITGTVGWEAITGGKNVLVFGNACYRTLPGVFEYKESLDISEIIDYKVDHKYFTKVFNEFDETTLLKGVVAGGNGKDFNPDFNILKNNEEVYDSLKLAITYY